MLCIEQAKSCRWSPLKDISNGELWFKLWMVKMFELFYWLLIMVLVGGGMKTGVPRKLKGVSDFVIIINGAICTAPPMSCSLVFFVFVMFSILAVLFWWEFRCARLLWFCEKTYSFFHKARNLENLPPHI